MFFETCMNKNENSLEKIREIEEDFEICVHQWGIMAMLREAGICF